MLGPEPSERCVNNAEPLISDLCRLLSVTARPPDRDPGEKQVAWAFLVWVGFCVGVSEFGARGIKYLEGGDEYDKAEMKRVPASQQASQPASKQVSNNRTGPVRMRETG